MPPAYDDVITIPKNQTMHRFRRMLRHSSTSRITAHSSASRSTASHSQNAQNPQKFARSVSAVVSRSSSRYVYVMQVIAYIISF